MRCSLSNYTSQMKFHDFSLHQLYSLLKYYELLTTIYVWTSGTNHFTGVKFQFKMRIHHLSLILSVLVLTEYEYTYVVHARVFVKYFTEHSVQHSKSDTLTSQFSFHYPVQERPFMLFCGGCILLTSSKFSGMSCFKYSKLKLNCMSKIAQTSMEVFLFLCPRPERSAGGI